MFKRRQSVFLDDETTIFNNKIEKSYRLTPLIVSLSTEKISTYDVQKLIELGLHVIRFKMSLVTRGDKIKLLSMLKTAVGYCCEKYEVSTWPIAISIDLPHSCIRTGHLCEGTNADNYLAMGIIVQITSNIKFRNRCSKARIYIDDHNVLKTIRKGTEVTLNTGSICLLCTKVIDFQTIECKVTKPGQLNNKEYVCIRGVRRKISVDLSETDMELINFAKEFNLDIITIKSVQSPIILKKVRAIFEDAEAPLLVSAICDQEGLDNIDAIIEESDGIILAREFLAFQLAYIYKLPGIQLQLSEKCRKLGKPFFISGNILESTLINGDISDITNAVAHRAGFVLQNYDDINSLIEAVKIVDSVCRSIEPRTEEIEFWIASSKIVTPVNAAEACVLGCALAARQVKALIIVVPTVTGRSALQLTRVITDIAILTVSSNPSVARKLQLQYGIIPIIYDKKAKRDWHHEMKARIRFAVSYGIKHNLLKYGSPYVALRKSHQHSSFADAISISKATVQDSEVDRNYVECQASQLMGSPILQKKRVKHLT